MSKNFCKLPAKKASSYKCDVNGFEPNRPPFYGYIFYYPASYLLLSEIIVELCTSWAPAQILI